MAARACPPPGSRITHATDQAILDATADRAGPDWELLAELPFQGNRGFAAAVGRSPALTATCLASAAALVLVVNTPGVSQFFGCTPLGPAAWAIVCASAATATAASLAASRRR